METVAYSTFRNGLRGYMRKARNDAAPILITAKDPQDNAVLMNAADYDTLMETVRIYENPHLLDKITRGMREARSGNVATHDLVEGDDD